ncbi:putative membrane protein [Microbacteriaceae bacterium SG_E_30_P1]|uniref:Membrane protein n=1 Tax=Antiquaquibacter oligotrophicus TaxID=2880260 RepID=A0ABT6KQT8_9MICO|nr:hypothetical protein [Antiquaquibacter oligotrophicus]MDH6182209.1 putative membrane protein [Antiquaquibacter oligotrophicus]UDF12131.1 hypothetical protein LH407_08105 [Antiquaquibacter oligotrophicus]
MTYEEKGVWVYLVVTLGAYGTYLAIVLGQLAATPVAEIDYVPALLWTIGASIAAAIVLRIVVEMFGPSESQKADARDRDLKRTGDRLGGWPIIAGALGALVLAIVQAEYFWIANSIYLGFAASAVLSSVITIVLYRRGL